jgi:hypothetical protein
MSIRALDDDCLDVEIAVSNDNGQIAVHLEHVHQMITCCGFRPDMSISEELQARSRIARTRPHLQASSMNLLR